MQALNSFIHKECPNAGHFIRNGFYRRKSDSKTIKRWRCPKCGRSISQSTGTNCYRQHKRRVNEPLRKLLNSGVSQRRAAWILKVHRKTVERKHRFLAAKARDRQNRYLEPFEKVQFIELQFDEMESFEHTKLKPLSMIKVVDAKTRKILGVKVSEMPAKGLLAAKSRAKYGPRKDGRKEAFISLFSEIKKYIHPEAWFRSDSNPFYPGWLKQVNPNWKHETVKGQRGAVTGQGELKKVAFDPIFSLNHTCAMNRANINRLFRRTWCTTKKKERLQDHMDLYRDFHNRHLTG